MKIGLVLAKLMPLDQILQHGNRVEFTPELAERVLAKCRYKHHAEPSPMVVGFIVDQIKYGDFSNQWLEFAQLGGDLILIKGLARMKAIIQSRLPAWFKIFIRQVKSEAELYASAAKPSPT